MFTWRASSCRGRGLFQLIQPKEISSALPTRPENLSPFPHRHQVLKKHAQVCGDQPPSNYTEGATRPWQGCIHVCVLRCNCGLCPCANSTFVRSSTDSDGGGQAPGLVTETAEPGVGGYCGPELVYSSGNAVVLKPSELSENMASLLATIIPQYLDKVRCTPRVRDEYVGDLVFGA